MFIAGLCCCVGVLGANPESSRGDPGVYGLLVPGRFLHIPGPNPVLLPGPAGAWDDGVIEAADALHDGPVYYFFYHGTGQGRGYRLGVATASAPLGPFRKHGGRPILDLGPPGNWDDRNVACAMVLRESPGRYWMWYSGSGSGLGSRGKWSIGLASAPHPLGPWKKHPANPVLEDFGYAFSRDGYSFQKHAQNPVAAREACPNAAAFAEVHAIYEPPVVYLYHTLRYMEPRTPEDAKRFPAVENLGIEALVTSRPYRLQIPVICGASVAPNTTTAPADALPLALRGVERLSLTVHCLCGEKAARGPRLHLQASSDGKLWTTARQQEAIELPPGRAVDREIPVPVKWPSLKVLVENPDSAESILNLDVTANVSG